MFIVGGFAELIAFVIRLAVIGVDIVLGGIAYIFMYLIQSMQ